MDDNRASNVKSEWEAAPTPHKSLFQEDGTPNITVTVFYQQKDNDNQSEEDTKEEKEK